MKTIHLKIKRARWWLLPLLITGVLFTVSGKKQPDKRPQNTPYQNDSIRKDQPGDEAMRVRTMICP